MASNRTRKSLHSRLAHRCPLRTPRSHFSGPNNPIGDQHPAWLYEEPYCVRILASVGVDFQARNQMDLRIIFDGLKSQRQS